MLSDTINQAITGFTLPNTIQFIKGFLKGKPTRENPFWVKIKQIIESRKEQFQDELGTGDFREIIQIINNI